MEEKMTPLINNCNFANVKPIMMELSYPPIQVREKNQAYANLLSIDCFGAVSEMSTIAQYINHENRISYQKCPIAKTILGIAMAEMVHLQKLGELVFLLGGNVDFSIKQRDGKQKMWTPEYLNLPDNVRKMILVDIEGEKAAINQYRMHIKMINDNFIHAVLARIIKDEEYHIFLLQALINEL